LEENEMAMTSQKRVAAVLNHIEPDRVPVNYIANGGIEKRLMNHFGVKQREQLLKALNVDFRSIGAPYIGSKLHEDLPGRTVDNWGIHRRWIEHDTGGYWDYCDFPLKDVSLEVVKTWPMPSPDDFDYEVPAKMCKEYKDFAIVVGDAGCGDTINNTGMIRTMEQTLVDLITENPVGLTYIDRRHKIQLEVMRRTIEICKGRVDLIWIGEDLGTQRAPLISLDLFRKVIRPRLQDFVDIGKHFGIPVMIHSCGSSSWAFSDFIDMGISCVDTLQPEADNMAPSYLKSTFGDKLSFHGCISTAGPVAYGSVDDVIKNVHETLEIMMPGGGYCLAPTHSLQDNSPVENVVAMYESARKYGTY